MQKPQVLNFSALILLSSYNCNFSSFTPFLHLLGGDSGPRPAHGASCPGEEPVVVHPRGGHHHERPRFLAPPQGESGVFSTEQQLLGPLHGRRLPLP